MSDQSSAQPFAFKIPYGQAIFNFSEARNELRRSKIEAYLENHPRLRDVVCMADTTTQTNDITHCNKDTVVHDGNNTYTMQDEKQDDIEPDTLVVD